MNKSKAVEQPLSALTEIVHDDSSFPMPIIRYLFCIFRQTLCKHSKWLATFPWHLYSPITSKLMIHLHSLHTCVKHFCTACSHMCHQVTGLPLWHLKSTLLMLGCPVSEGSSFPSQAGPACILASLLNQPAPAHEAKLVEGKQQQQGRTAHLPLTFLSVLFQTD